MKILRLEKVKPLTSNGWATAGRIYDLDIIKVLVFVKVVQKLDARDVLNVIERLHNDLLVVFFEVFVQPNGHHTSRPVIELSFQSVSLDGVIREQKLILLFRELHVSHDDDIVGRLVSWLIQLRCRNEALGINK